MTAAILVAPNIWRIPTAPMDLLNSYLLRSDDGQLTLVDTGLKNAPKRIVAAIEEVGGGISDVTRIVLTHAHSDHAGGLRELTIEAGVGATVHDEDAEFVRAGRAAPRDPATRLGRLLTRLPSDFDAAPVEATMADGDILPIAGGLQVAHTPGHSPGHVSLLQPDSGVLITGDAIWNPWGRRSWPVLAFCTNIALTKQTAHRLAELDYTTAAFTHGTHIPDTGREAVRTFLAKPRNFPGLW